MCNHSVPTRRVVCVRSFVRESESESGGVVTPAIDWALGGRPDDEGLRRRYNVTVLCNGIIYRLGPTTKDYDDDIM